MRPRLLRTGIAIILTTIVNTPMKIKSSTLTSADVIRLIEYARDAELCRNLDLFRGILSAFWEDIDTEPELSSFGSTIRSELLRLCGVFLSQYGRARGFPAFQNRAKDILTRAAELFEVQNYPDKEAETKVGLATCYWYSGEVEEHDAMLRSVEAEFRGQPDHQVSIQIKLNRILVAVMRHDLEEAQYLVNEVGKVISASHNVRLRTQFHNLAGITFLFSDLLDLSAFHLDEAVRISREVNNSLFVAFNLNNLAMVYRASKCLDKAQRTINEAISIMESREDTGWIPHALDTKALIYIDEAEYEKALEVIEKSIEVFSEGEDYTGLTDAMWTKCLCLLRLARVRECTVLFAELTEIAARQIGEVAVDKFTTLLMEQIYILKQFPLTDELSVLKRSLVVKAIRQTRGHMARASKVLGLRSQQHLSQILNREFPDIYDELGIKRRARRSKATRKKEPPLGLSRLIMPKGRTYSFNFNWRGTLEPQFFYFPKYLMLAFGIKAVSVRLAFDELAKIFLVDLEELIFLSDVTLIGVPIGYCPVADRYKKTMKFERLEFIKED